MFFVVMLMFLAVMIAMITFAPITASVTIFITLTARWLLHGAALTMPYRSANCATDRATDDCTIPTAHVITHCRAACATDRAADQRAIIYGTGIYAGR